MPVGAFHPGRHQSESGEKDGGEGSMKEGEDEEENGGGTRNAKAQRRLNAYLHMAVGATVARSAPLHSVVRSDSCSVPLTAPPHLFCRLRRLHPSRTTLALLHAFACHYLPTLADQLCQC